MDIPQSATASETSFDPTDPDEPTASVVRALAAIEGVPETAIPPLYRLIDTDALNRLVDGTARVRLTVAVDGHSVSVDGTGTVRVEEMGDVPPTGGVAAE